MDPIHRIRSFQVPFFISKNFMQVDVLEISGSGDIPDILVQGKDGILQQQVDFITTNEPELLLKKINAH